MSSSDGTIVASAGGEEAALGGVGAGAALPFVLILTFFGGGGKTSSSMEGKPWKGDWGGEHLVGGFAGEVDGISGHITTAGVLLGRERSSPTARAWHSCLDMLGNGVAVTHASLT